MAGLFALFFFASALNAQSLPTGLYQAVREDGRPFHVEIGGRIRKALFVDGASTNVLSIMINRDKSFSFRTSEGVELFSSADTPVQKLSRPRYSLAPIPAEGVILHRGFVVSALAFQGLDGNKTIKTNLDTLAPRYALLEAKSGFWIESYFDEKKSPTEFLGRAAYRALSMDGIHWAVLSLLNIGTAGEYSHLSIFRKNGSELSRTALLAEGNKGFGGLLGMELEGRNLSYWRNIDSLPPRWPGLYAEALGLAMQNTGGKASLVGQFVYSLGGKPELEEIHLAEGILGQGGVLAKKGAVFRSPREFQGFLRTLMPEALRRREMLNLSNQSNQKSPG